MGIIISANGGFGNTMVPNIFIDKYMKRLNDVQIKVYLYLLLSLGSNTPFTLEDIADKYNYSERDVIRAVKFLGKEGLVRLTLDMSGDIAEIDLIRPEEIEDIDKEDDEEEVVETKKEEEEDDGVLENTGPVLVAEPIKAPPNPGYRAGRIKKFRQEEGSEEIIKVIESYLKKNLTSADLGIILYMHFELEFDFAMLDLLVQHVVGRGHRDMKYIETVAVSWYKQGIRTPEQAKTGADDIEAFVAEVFSSVGSISIPTETDIKMVGRWRGEWGFSKDMIIGACERAVRKVDGGAARLSYTNGILSRWLADGLKTPEDVLIHEDVVREENKKKYEKKTYNGPKSTGISTSYQPKKQCQYDFEALQKIIDEN